MGATCRYLIGVAMVTRLHLESPWATLFVNLLGCFLFGVVSFWGPHGAEASMSPHLKLAILTGFLGAFTTFSTYSYDTIQIYQLRGLSWAVGYVLAQNFLGWLAAGLGMFAARGLSSRGTAQLKSTAQRWSSPTWSSGERISCSASFDMRMGRWSLPTHASRVEPCAI
jgi:fluoride exporter